MAFIRLGIGAVVGMALGVLGAWALDGNCLICSFLGGGIGLASGMLLIFLASYFEEREKE
ncbi:MAG: hypothetical protein BTN85_1840 [Candidatus Methanohalarchaeum thermophilum]|uniref:Uncharacterized protein n=1 Tax=Methanohalarchaeum thermophilum TaxID=1903181 RepID=A0A1Q6DS70_METT1|nr:MAG: hypothetical protein BTN85_1840 [Candidatus Methanohalarchaeum thermophilum]